MSNVDNLVSGANKLGISLTGEQINQFLLFQNLLIEWNKRINLTAVQEPEQIQTRHFVDSLTCVLGTGHLNGKLLVDVGSGAGFPGIPLKICFPEMELVLLESIHKKTDFLQKVVEQLNLHGVQIYSERAETFAHFADQREKYDFAVARAVAPLPILVEYLLPLVRLGGAALAQKGKDASQELEEARNAIAKLGGGPVEKIQINMDQWEYAWLLKIVKASPTSEKYPRRPGMPSKRPL